LEDKEEEKEDDCSEDEADDEFLVSVRGGLGSRSRCGGWRIFVHCGLGLERCGRGS